MPIAELGVRNIHQSRESVRLHESEPLEAPVVRTLGQLPALGEQRLEEPDPIERDDSQRKDDVIGIVARSVFRRAGGSVRDPAQNSQERELVGGRLVVIQDDVTDQRQRTGAIVRNPDCNLFPADSGAPEKVRPFARPFDEGAMLARKLLYLRPRHREHATDGVDRLAQRKRDHPARLDQSDQLAKRALAVRRGDVHPHRVDEDEIEREPGPDRLGQIGQTVPQIPDSRFRMPPSGLFPHTGRRLDGDDLVSKRREPRRVPPASRPDIENAARPRG